MRVLKVLHLSESRNTCWKHFNDKFFKIAVAVIATEPGNTLSRKALLRKKTCYMLLNVDDMEGEDNNWDSFFFYVIFSILTLCCLELTLFRIQHAALKRAIKWYEFWQFSVYLSSSGCCTVCWLSWISKIAAESLPAESIKFTLFGVPRCRRFSYLFWFLKHLPTPLLYGPVEDKIFNLI